MLVGFIQREAGSLAPKELTRQMLQATMEESLDKDGPLTPVDEVPRTPDKSSIRQRTRTLSSPISPTALSSMFKSFIGNTNNARSDWSTVQVSRHLMMIFCRILL